MQFGKLFEQNILVTTISTGAGAGAQNMLWQIPGASKIFNGSLFPYSREEVDQLLGFSLEKYTSEEAAISLACIAFMRSCETLELRMRNLALDDPKLKTLGQQKPIGIGLTATVASNYKHRGSHQIFVAAVTEDTVICEAFPIPKGVGVEQRIFDGSECDKIMINALYAAINLEQIYPYHQLRPHTGAVKNFLFVKPYFSVNGQRGDGISNLVNLFPVTANPLHEGHEGMALESECQSGRPTVYVLTANEHNVHKPTSLQTILRRIAMIKASNRLTGQNRGVFITDKTLFVDILQDNPAQHIILGEDAFLRAMDPKWLGGKEETRKRFDQVLYQNCLFRVFTRNNGSEAIRQAAQPIISDPLAVRIYPYNKSISSTEIRQHRGCL